MTPREEPDRRKRGRAVHDWKADKIKLSLLCYIKNDHEEFVIHE
jgi:hypothetical protein